MQSEDRETVNGVDRRSVDDGSRQGVASQFLKNGRRSSRNGNRDHGTERLTRTVSTKVTEAEDAHIRAFAAAQGIELSAFVRLTLLAAVQGKSLQPPSVVMLELYKRSMAALLRLGDAFTEADFLRICADLEKR